MKATETELRTRELAEKIDQLQCQHANAVISRTKAQMENDRLREQIASLLASLETAYALLKDAWLDERNMQTPTFAAMRLAMESARASDIDRCGAGGQKPAFTAGSGSPAGEP